MFKNYPRVVTWYTPRYAPFREGFQKSCDKYGICCHIEADIEELPWKQGLYERIVFLQDIIRIYRDENLLWLDIDAIFLKEPDFLDDLQNQLTLHAYQNPPKNQLYTGAIIGFKANDISMKLFDTWRDYYKRNMNSDDSEKSLTSAVEHVGIVPATFPIEYYGHRSFTNPDLIIRFQNSVPLH